MRRFPSPAAITPAAFELQVKNWLVSSATDLVDFRATHLEKLKGADGEYEFDVTARFEAFGGASFLVVVECKKHMHPIKREVIQALRDKQQSVGAQKAMVVSTSSFQSGAIEYASMHNIALVQIVSGSVAYIQASAAVRKLQISPDAEDYVGLFYGSNLGGQLIFPQLLSSRMNLEMQRYFEASQTQ